HVPKAFTGGDLVLFASNGQPTVIEPVNDSMVLFSSRTKHEVKPVVCPSRRFEDGRFTINGWVRRRTRVRNDSWFGYQMFVPSQRTAASSVALATSSPLPRATLGSARANEGQIIAALATRVAKVESLLTLYGDLHRVSRNRATIDVRRQLSGDEFLE